MQVSPMPVAANPAPDDTPPPVGRAIMLVAWMFIAVGAAGLLKDWLPLVTPGAADQIARLRAEGMADWGPAWTTRLASVIGGVWLLRRQNWARWLLLAWMAFHVALSALHSRTELLLHLCLFTPVTYLLFRAKSASWFRAPGT